MKQGFFSEHWVDENGNPAGGVTIGKGFTISWQNGPLGQEEDRLEPNGAFVEDVIEAAINRIEVYQDSEFACTENAMALGNLKLALKALELRTKRRTQEGTEGTHIKSDSEGRVLPNSDGYA